MAGSIRIRARSCLEQLLKDSLTGTDWDVHRGWPGDRMSAQCIWLGSTRGELSVPVFTGADWEANPVRYDDAFTVPIHFVSAKPGEDHTETEESLDAAYQRFELALRRNPQLQDLGHDMTGLRHALLQDLVIETMATKEGIASFADVDVRCTSRISGGTS